MIITSTGWSLPVVDAVTFPDAMELLTYWGEHPPAHVTLAGIVKSLAGTGSKGETLRPPTLEELHSLADQFKR